MRFMILVKADKDLRSGRHAFLGASLKFRGASAVPMRPIAIPIK
jgi:kynurenine formamidase